MVIVIKVGEAGDDVRDSNPVGDRARFSGHSGCVSSDDQNAFVPIQRVYSVNTCLLISLSHKGVNERAYEWSKQAKRSAAAQVSGVSGASELT